MIVQEAIDLIKHYEGFNANPYQDSGGVWTQGYGFTGPDITADSSPIGPDQANQILIQKLHNYETGVKSLLTDQTNANQLGALVSFAYNLGLGALGGSTLLRLHNEGQYNLAQAEFPKWNHDDGIVLDGLTKRRNDEAKLYGTPSNVIV